MCQAVFHFSYRIVHVQEEYDDEQEYDDELKHEDDLAVAEYDEDDEDSMVVSKGEEYVDEYYMKKQRGACVLSHPFFSSTGIVFLLSAWRIASSGNKSYDLLVSTTGRAFTDNNRMIYRRRRSGATSVTIWLGFANHLIICCLAIRLSSRTVTVLQVTAVIAVSRWLRVCLCGCFFPSHCLHRARSIHCLPCSATHADAFLIMWRCMLLAGHVWDWYFACWWFSFAEYCNRNVACLLQWGVSSVNPRAYVRVRARILITTAATN